MKKKLLSLLLAVLIVLPPVAPAFAANVSDYAVIASTFNADAVSNCAEGLPRYNLNDGTNVLLQAVTTYHYNGGKGAKPGTIKIYDEYGGKETLLGTWNAVGRDGNKYWDIFPNIVMKDRHKYTFEPSDTSTWSSNEAADYLGFIELRGIKPYYGNADQPTVTQPTVTTKTATLTYNNIKINIDGKEIIPTDVSGNYVAPFVIDGTTYMPVRAVAGALGLGVEWDGSTNTIRLTSGASVTARTGR